MSKPFANVPGHWQAPYGPYRRAPEQYGGQWWFVNPFTGEEPWLRASFTPEEETLPEGFEAIFGKRPVFADFPNSTAWRIARTQWELNLKRFTGAGRPLWLSLERGSKLSQLYKQWGMGEPHFYGGRYGEMVRFPESQVQDFEQAAYTVANYPHHVIAMYQAELAEHGIDVPDDKRHPFVPPHVFGDGDDK